MLRVLVDVACKSFVIFLFFISRLMLMMEVRS